MGAKRIYASRPHPTANGTANGHVAEAPKLAPVHQTAAAITAERLERVTRILHADLCSKFGIAAPRILVCGLNPHAGEGGR